MRRAFTLVELMIAVGLMVILMAGVGIIFKSAGQATGQGQIVSQITRNAQAAQVAMGGDFTAMATSDSPCILLRSKATPAFRNRQDQLGAPDQTNPMLDIDPAGSGSVITYQPSAFNYRNHRTDILSFFARGAFHRQTGGGTISTSGTSYEPLVSASSGLEAWVWYGHLDLADNNSPQNFLTPGSSPSTTNPNNFYATQWILGRVGIILQEPTVNGGTQTIPVIENGQSIDEDFIFRSLNPSNTDRAPLSVSSPGTGTNPTGVNLQDCRYDLAGTSISGYRTILKNVITNSASLSNGDWWSGMMLKNRFQCNPFVIKPMNAQTYSQQMPVLLQGCTHFIVEYAGDFLTQDNDPTSPTYGNVTDTCYDTTTLPLPTQKPTDNQIDYILSGTAPNLTKQIRWYGFPRDTSGDGKITSTAGSTDVVPLRDIWEQLPREANSNAPFERFADSASSNSLTKQPDYAAIGAVTSAPSEYYTCAWGPSDLVRPSLIRITVVVDDPSGRLADGLTFQYVFMMP